MVWNMTDKRDGPKIMAHVQIIRSSKKQKETDFNKNNNSLC